MTESIIDIGKIWKELDERKEDLEREKKVLCEIKKKVKPSMITTLFGKAPALLFLITQHFLYGKTGEIWYQENLSTKPIIIVGL